MRGKTITTYLIHGHPKGPRAVFISNKICKALLVPRIELKEMLGRTEFKLPCMYFLINAQDEKIYIGETECFSERVKSHQNQKLFWDEAILFTSKDNDLTKSDVKYLEMLAIREATHSGQFELSENRATPKPTHLPEHQLASIEEFFDDVKILTSFLGYSVFECFESMEKSDKDLFFCKGRGADARGFYSKDGFTVLRGSTVPISATNSYRSSSDKRLMKIKKSALKITEETYKLNRDILFPSPSAASSFCIGNNTNGWVTWVNQFKQTLDEVFRN